MNRESSQQHELSSIKKQKEDTHLRSPTFEAPTSRQQVLNLLRRSGLPHNLIKRLLNDVDGRPHYNRVPGVDHLETHLPNSTYVGNIYSKCLCACTDGFLVENGTLGKLRINDSFRFAAPGYHKISVFGSEFEGAVSTIGVNSAVSYGPAGFVTVCEGNIGVLAVGAEYRLLAPGTYQWNSPAVRFEGSVDVTQNISQLGPYSLITIPTGSVAVTFQSGCARILGWNNDDSSILDSIISSPWAVTPNLQKCSKVATKNENGTETEIFTKNIQDFENLLGGDNNNEANLFRNSSDEKPAILFLGGTNKNHHYTDGVGNIQEHKILTVNSNNHTNDSFASFLPSPPCAGTELKTFGRAAPDANMMTSQNNNNNNTIKLPDAQPPQKLFSLIQQRRNDDDDNKNGEDHEPQLRTYFLDDPKWLHSCFLSLKTQTDRLEGNDLLSKDNVEIIMVAMSQWRISNPILAINECADDMESIRVKVNSLVRATIARIVSSTTISCGHAAASVSGAKNNVEKKTQNKEQVISKKKIVINPLLKPLATDQTSGGEVENVFINKQHNKNNNGDDDDDADHDEPEVEHFVLPPTPQCGKQGKKIQSDKNELEQKAERETAADLAHLMQSVEARIHMSALEKSLSTMGIEILAVYVPERRMKNDDIRQEVSRQAVIGIHAEAERAAADANAYSIVTAARAEAEAISELARAHSEAGKMLGKAENTAGRMALSEIMAKALIDADVTLFSGVPF